MKRSLKYGLTTALRSFEEPDVWDGQETIAVTGATVLADVFHEKQRMVTIGVPANAQGEVHIDRTIYGNCHTHIVLGVESAANITVIETLTGEGNLRSNTQVSIGQQAKVKYTIIQALASQSVALLHYEAQTNNCALQWLFCGIGADTTQAYIGTKAGDNSEIENNAVIYGTGQQQFDIHVATTHQGEHSKSNMLTRSVLDDRARAIYHGLIHIGPESAECDSYQKDEVILLSPTAGADAIPNLEIQNNRVRCSHGASIGKLDEEKLFYCKSRGVTEAQAKRMITEGFLFELLPKELHKLITAKAGGVHEDDASQ